MEVLWEDNVKAYICSQKFRIGALPVETAMCNTVTTSRAGVFFQRTPSISASTFFSSCNRYASVFLFQDVHPMTLSACFVMATSTSKPHSYVLVHDMVRKNPDICRKIRNFAEESV
jgi:hypothetical protein